jgi:hypothetical protein
MDTEILERTMTEPRDNAFPPEMVEWLRSRPEPVQKLMREFPPECKVMARESVELMVPAPGVVGTVTSWFEDGTLGVDAPLQAEGLARGLAIAAEHGREVEAHEHQTFHAQQVRPDQIEHLEDGPISRAEVAAILDSEVPS